jgi:L-lactate dehydrogenase complex protein LldE
MRVALFVSCLVDQMWPSAGVATVEVLRRAGCEVDFDPRQTCCGQPAFNTGYLDEARRVARQFLDVMGESDAEAIIVPSGSCGAMVHRLGDLFETGVDADRAREVAAKTHEFAGFLINVLGVQSVGGHFAGRVTWHDACHGLRDLGLRDEPRQLIRSVRGIELVELPREEACCGFGGSFAVRHPELSVAMLDRRLEGLDELGVDALVSGDVGCLMQIEGRLQRLAESRSVPPVRSLHLAELLVADGALP